MLNSSPILYWYCIVNTIILIIIIVTIIHNQTHHCPSLTQVFEQ